MTHIPDVDIDFADRNAALQELVHIPVSNIKNSQILKHNTGIYFQDIPVDPISALASIDEDRAEELGYFKFDFLNLHIYKQVRDETHLLSLMKEPIWEILEEESVVDTLFHLNGNFDIVSKMKPKTIMELAIVVAIKLPCKRHLIGKKYDDVLKEIWQPGIKGEYYLKKPHAVAYAHVIVVQMNLMMELLDEP